MVQCRNCQNLYNLSNNDEVIVGKWCPKINDSPHEEIERDCEYYKSNTNADRIRAMTDEQLADLFNDITDDVLKGSTWNKTEWIGWLQMRVDTQNND